MRRAALIVMAAMILTGGAAVAVADVPATAEQERFGIDPGAVAEETPAAPAERRATVGATVVVKDGDAGNSSLIDLINNPYTDGTGKMGFRGDEAANDPFVWYDSGITFSYSDDPTNLTGGESTMGVSSVGGFIISPSIAGDDGVWTDAGQLAVENVQAPDQPAGINSTFHSRPTMIPTGAAYWVAGLNDGAGGTSTVKRVFYVSTDGTPATISTVLEGGDLVGALIIADSGIQFSYDISDDGSHHLHELNLDSTSATDGSVYLDGAIVAREGSANGTGDNWDNFDYFSVNNSGHYLFTGDTDGSTATDEFIAYDGAIVIREGDVVDGITLASSAFVRGAALNNLGNAVYAWAVDGGAEHVFYACDASDLAATSKILFSTGDDLDLDGNGTGDTTVTDLESVFHNLTLDDTGPLYFDISTDDGTGEIEAIVAFERPSCAAGGLVINEIDYDQASTDTEEFVEIYNASGAAINLDPYALEFVNGSGGAIYDTIDLPDVDLGPGEFYVVCANAATVPNCDLDDGPDTNFIQNGAPDAVALVEVLPTDGTLQTIVDTVSYEGSVAGYVEGSGDGLEDNPGTDYFSISRTTDGVDTDQNNVDFAGRCNSPGVANMTTTTGCALIPVELMTFTVD